ncbi:acyltransferase family protein [Demequina subtropica]|uniref:acyltransferase family protein n=1 Tax=Demequina subtropica TaxID=1638989 RepID=UPI0007828482|nr:acyltransferase family protein [Demequina subtropica]
MATSTTIEDARVTPGRAPESPKARSHGGHRKDIQALRALAIGGVLINHLVGWRLPGGYIGVDVFFVISGFLITGIIARDITAHRFSLASFWGRRVRRLMPASFLVVLATAVATALVVPHAMWRQFSEEAIAATLYVENWQLAAAGSDYFSEDLSASPARHFWSLSVEEQYYIAIPVLMVLLWLLVRRRARRFAVAAPTVLVVAFVASFAWALHGLADAQTDTFYPTTMRVWEFALGGVVALLPALLASLGVRIRVPDMVRAPLVWASWLAIIGAMVMFTAGTAHPGYPTLVPTVATALILGLGSTALRWDAVRIAGTRPIQWLGDVSYSLYLWHWPIIIISGYAFPDAPHRLLVAGQLAASLACAAISYRFVEQRYLAPSRDRLFTGRRTLAILLIGTLAVLSLPVATIARADREAEANAEAVQLAVSHGDDCLGAAAVTRGPECAGVEPAALLPALGDTGAGGEEIDRWIGDQDCFYAYKEEGFSTCHATGGTGQGPRVFVVGDSHANQLKPIVHSLAQEYDWDVSMSFRASCAYTFAQRTTFGPLTTRLCTEWQHAAADEIRTGDYDLIITSGLSGVEWELAGADNQHDAGVAGLTEAWQVAVDSGARVLAFTDLPHPVEDVQKCAAIHGLEGAERCAHDRSEALPFDPQADAAAGFSPGEVTVLDLTDTYCSDDTCSPVVGGVLVYRDQSHMTPLWATTLTPEVIDRTPEAFLVGSSA